MMMLFIYMRKIRREVSRYVFPGKTFFDHDICINTYNTHTYIIYYI